MTGESLLNGSINILSKQATQGTALGVDKLLEAPNLEVLGAIAMFILMIALIKYGYEKGKSQ